MISKWLDHASLVREYNAQAQRLLEAEGQVAVLRYELEVAQDAALKWEMRSYELMPEGNDTKLALYKKLTDQWRAECRKLRNELRQLQGLEPDDTFGAGPGDC